MVDNTPSTKQESGILPAVVFWPLMGICAFLMTGAFIFCYRICQLPSGDLFDHLRLFRAMFFSQGLALGLFGATTALNSKFPRRGYASAVTLYGFGFMLFSFVAHRSLERQIMGFRSSLLTWISLMIIVVMSTALFVRTWLRERAERTKEKPSEEPQQPLSQP